MHDDSATADTVTTPALHTPPNTPAADAPAAEITYDDDDEVVEISGSDLPNSEDDAATPRTRLANLQKRLEPADEDYDEVVDEDDVESVPTHHACTHSPTYAAHNGQTAPDIQLRPTPLLRTHANSFPVYPPPPLSQQGHTHVASQLVST